MNVVNSIQTRNLQSPDKHDSVDENRKIQRLENEPPKIINTERNGNVIKEV